MDKRTLLAVALCAATLIIWSWLFPPPKQGQPPAITASSQSTAPAVPPSASPAAAAAPAVPGAAGQPAPEAAPEKLFTIEHPGLYRATVSSHGAALTHFTLLNPKYAGTELVGSRKPALVVRFPHSGFTFPEDPQQQLFTAPAEVTALPDGGQRLVFQWQSAEAQVRKTLDFSATQYHVSVSVEVKNLKTAPVNHHFDIGVEGYQNPAQKPGGMFSARVPQNDGLWDIGGKMQSANLDGLQKGVALDKLRGDVRWIGVGQQYFLLAAALPHADKVGDKQARAAADAEGDISLSAEYEERTLKPGESLSYAVTVFAGPKLPELLDAVAVAGVPAGLSTAIEFKTLPVLGWIAATLVRPMLWVLRQLHELVRSWALAIVLLTMLVKLVTLYPTHKSMKSMKAMADLKPDIDKLKEKCGEDRQLFNTEMMKLYKQHGINPLGGCLPMLVQMPIWIALYSMLASAVELYHQPFLTPAWIPDLTAPDRFYVLPLLTGGLMFLQTKLSPPPADPQQKMMANMMPVMFTGFSLFLPAGLTLYIMTNTLLGMVQQTVINRGRLKR